MQAFNLPNGLNLRFAEGKDQSFLHSLYRSTRHDLLLMHQDAELVDAIIAMQFEAQTQGYAQQFPEAIYWIVELNNKCIGKVAVDFSSDCVHIVDLALLPQYQNQGYGQSLISALKDAAKKVATPLLISTAKDNTRALFLYKKMGFILDDSSPSALYQRLIWYPESIKSYSFA